MINLFRRKSPVSQSTGDRIPRRRHYQMAKLGGTTADWFSGDSTPDQLIFGALRRSRNRARDLARNDDYTRRFITLAKTNVVGPEGFVFRARAYDWRNGRKELDRPANGKIDDSFYSWAKPGHCTLDRVASLTDVENQIVSGLIVDGEFLARKVRGRFNDWGFALQAICPSRLDEQLNQQRCEAVAGVMDAQNEIRMGVEIDRYGAPVAYHFIRGESNVTSIGHTTHEGHDRIPADEIVHVFIQEVPGQTRGITLLAPVAYRKRMLDGFMESVTVGARVAAAKMGWLIRDPENPADEPEQGPGAGMYDLSPGQIEEMPFGFNDFKPFDPGYPPANFEEFTKNILHGIAAGLGVSYLALSGDLKGVSYSGGRLAMLADQDAWRCMQRFVIEHFCEKFYPDWLQMALTTGAVDLPLAKIEKFLVHRWRGRGWRWADPKREVDAQIAAIKAGIKSFTEVCDEIGNDFEEVVEELSENYALAEKMGITLLLDGPVSAFVDDDENTNPENEGE